MTREKIPTASIECDPFRVKALIDAHADQIKAVVSVTMIGDHTEEYVRLHTEAIEELTSVLNDMLRPPRFTSNDPDDVRF